MVDEKEGPYKLVQKMGRGGVILGYSIVIEQRGGSFKEIVQEVNNGQDARQICNLLNKNYREVLHGLTTGEGWGTEGLDKAVQERLKDDEAEGTDGRGLDGDDQSVGRTGDSVSL